MAKHFQSKDNQSGTATRRAAALDVQTKLKTGSPGDRYEKEADQTAEMVAGQPNRQTRPAAAQVSRLGGDFGSKGTEEQASKTQQQEEPEEVVETKAKRPMPEGKEAQPKNLKQEAETTQAKVQRQPQEEDEETQTKVQRQPQKEEEETQTKVQRQPQKEEEATQTKVQRQPQEEEEETQTKVQRQPQEEEEETQTKVQRQPQEEEEAAQTKVQRQPQEEEEATQAKVQRQPQEEDETTQAKVQRQPQEEEEETQAKAEPRANIRDKLQYPVLHQVEPRLLASKGKGRPMDEEVRIDMEARFGADFSGVRIHTGTDAVRMAQDMKAQAFTNGQDIYFNEGKYDPESLAGRLLLAHELTHVIQQGKAEAKLSDAEVAENNANRSDPGPQPPDAEAQEAKAATEEAIEAKKAEQPEKPEEVALSLYENKDLKAVPEPEQKAGEGKEEKASPPKGKGGGASDQKEKKEEKQKQTEVAEFLKSSSEAKVQKKKNQLKKLAGNEKKKDNAGAKLAQTEKSVVPPAEEGKSKANASQVETVDQAEAPEPDEARAKEDLSRAMEEAIPSNLEEADTFKEEGKGQVVGEKVRGAVTADTQEVQSTYQEIENTPDPEPTEESEELPALEEAPETPPIDLGEDVIGEVQPEHTDLSEFENESDQQLEKEGISEEQLEMVDSGPLAEAKNERKGVKEQVKKAPEEVKEVEKKEKENVSTELKKEEAAGRREMREKRQKELKNTQEKQKKTKSKLEQKRQEVTDHINGIYERANSEVKRKLEELEKQSLKAFDEGQVRATQTFEDNVKRRLDAFKSDRYSGLFGWGRWLKDKLLGMDDLPAVKRIFDSEKATFIRTIDQLIARITTENKRVIQECKDLVQTARQEIAEYVDSLGPELQKTGQQAQSDMQARLDALDETVNQKEEELQKKLEEKREAAIKAIEEKIEKMKEAMKGALAKLAGFLLDAMIKFFKWALEKAGFDAKKLMEIINKGKAVLKAIVTEPVQFIKNLIGAVKLGIDNFVQNIKQHLIGGLISWLTGAMADIPIQLPDKWDLKGILHLILQILGLTWDVIRRKLVRRLGEKVMKVVESSVDIVQRLISEGPLALWEMIREKAAEIKEQVMEGIRNWVITQVVKQAVIKLLSFLNPAGAIVQAILAIYNTIMFFVENWQRIVDFVKSVFDSIGRIAAGAVSAAAGFIEKALAMTIPIILNFLARLIGLSGIGKAVSNIIKKIRRPIDKVVNKVIGGIVKKARSLFGKKGKKEDPKGKETGQPAVEQPFSMNGKPHKVKVTVGNNAQVFFDHKNIFSEISKAERELNGQNPKPGKVLTSLSKIETKAKAARSAAKQPRKNLKRDAGFQDLIKSLINHGREFEAKELLPAGAGGINLEKFSETYQDNLEKQHRISVNAKGRKNEITVASTPRSMVQFLKDKEGEIKNDPNIDEQKRKEISQAIQEAKTVVGQIDALINPPSGEPDQDADNKLKGLFAKVRNLAKTIDYRAVPVPPFKVSPPFSGKKAGVISMENFTRDSGVAGSPASAYNGNLNGALHLLEGWGVRNKWVAFHLINDNLGGKAVDSNLIPAHEEDNKSFLRDFEKNVKDLALKDRMAVWMKVSPSYESDGKFVKSINAEGGAMELKKKRWVPVKKGDKYFRHPMTLRNPQRNEINLNALRKLTVPERKVVLKDAPLEEALINYLFDNTTNPFKSKGEIIFLIESIQRLSPGKTERSYKSTITKWTNQINRTKISF